MDVAEVKRRSAAGPLALMARRLVAVLVGVLTTVTIPHFVSPRAYGVASMSMVLFGFAEMLKDAGLTSALMRKGEIAPAEVNLLFWFNALSTLLLTGLIALLAPAIAGYYGEPEVAPVILVSLIGFAAGGLAMQHRGLLSRDLRFADIAVIDSITTFVQFAATLGLAILWRDVWALVVGPVIGSVVSAALNVRYSRWRPGRPKMVPGAREMVAFGLNSLVYSMSVFVSNNVTTVLIARALGSSVLGQYNRASALMLLPAKNLVEPMAEATMPALARLRRSPADYRAAYLGLLTGLNLVVLPAAVLMAIAGPLLTTAFLGDQWRPAGAILQALAPAIAAVGYGYAISDLFITQDRAGELRTLGIVEMIGRVGAVALFVRYGAVAAALAFSISTMLVVCGRILVVGRKGPVTILDHARAALPALPVVGGVALAAGAALVSTADAIRSPFVAAILLLVASGAGGLGCGLAVRRTRAVLLATAASLRLPGTKRFAPPA